MMIISLTYLVTFLLACQWPVEVSCDDQWDMCEFATNSCGRVKIHRQKWPLWRENESAPWARPHWARPATHRPVPDFSTPGPWQYHTHPPKIEPQSRIIGGFVSYQESFPSTLLITRRKLSLSKRWLQIPICGGVIIGNHVALTAGHCLRQDANEPYKVYANPTGWSKEAIRYEFKHRRQGVKIIVPKEYDTEIVKEWHNQQHIYDWGLLIVEPAFELGPDVQPACLPQREGLYKVYPTYLAGFGLKASYQKNGDYLKIPHELQATRLIYIDCAKAYRERGKPFDSRQIIFCVTGMRSNPCIGDGGTGAYTIQDSKLTLVGIHQDFLELKETICDRYPNTYSRIIDVHRILPNLELLKDLCRKRQKVPDPGVPTFVPHGRRSHKRNRNHHTNSSLIQENSNSTSQRDEDEEWQ